MDQFSRTNYDSFNLYPSNNYYNRNYNFDNYSNNFSQSYVNNSRRIMTPTKNYASEYSSNYYSPSRNTGGCRECASSSAQLRHRSYSRPLTGNPLMRSTNYPSYNMNRDLFNSKDFRTFDPLCLEMEDFVNHKGIPKSEVKNNWMQYCNFDKPEEIFDFIERNIGNIQFVDDIVRGLI